MSSFSETLQSDSGTEGDVTQDQSTTGGAADQETGEEGTSGEVDDSTSEPETSARNAKRIKGLETALSETRKGKQAAQERIAYLEGRASASPGDDQGQAQEPAETEEEFWAAPLESRNRAIKRAVDQAMHEVDVKMVAVSAARMRKTHDDFDDTMKIYMDAQRENPQLETMAFGSGDPVGWAYEWAVQQREMTKSGGSIEAMRKQIRAELEAEMNASKKPATSPKTQAGARTSGSAAAGGGVENLDPFENKGY